MKTKFKSRFTGTELSISYYGDEGLCIRITDLDTKQFYQHVFILDKGVKKMIKGIRKLTGK